MIAEPTMNAREFANELVERMIARKPAGMGKTWTTAVYPVLYEVGYKAGFCVTCKPFDYDDQSGGKLQRVGDGEICDVDFMFFPAP